MAEMTSLRLIKSFIKCMFGIMKCPKCGSIRVIPIVAVFSDHDPQFHCCACGNNIGSPPVLINEHGEENYLDIVTSVRFRHGESFHGYDEVIIKKTASGIVADIASNLQRKYPGEQKSLTEEEWNKMLDLLFRKMYVHEWEKQYKNPNVMDGKQWKLEISLTDNRTLEYFGSNSYPAYWDELKQIFRPFFKIAGARL